MAEVLGQEMPAPESDDLGRYLEDTITIDWQTPLVMEQAQRLLSGCTTPEARVTAVFNFVRDEIRHSIDAGDDLATCSASQVLRERTGLCYAKSHLLAGLLRIAGFPTGFCYVRVASQGGERRPTLHGFNAVYWSPSSSWIYLDARGDREGISTEARFEAPWSLAYSPDIQDTPAESDREGFLPFIYRRPAKRIIDLLERAPDFDAVLRNLPDRI